MRPFIPSIWNAPSPMVHTTGRSGYAELLGLQGIRVDDPDAVGDAWDRAFAADRPVLLDVHTDKNVPPLPQHVTFDQAKGIAQALLSGDPDAREVVANSARAVAARVFASARSNDASE
jgi:pyruvate dehydrogenase (quinone)